MVIPSTPLYKVEIVVADLTLKQEKFTRVKRRFKKLIGKKVDGFEMGL